MSRAVIITSYIEYPLDIRKVIRDDDHIVCLDGGYTIALDQGIKPALLLGDFDSLRDDSPEEVTCRLEKAEASGITVMKYPAEKDQTDLELAFMVLDPDEYPEILVIGAMGGRLDQTAINLQLITKYTAGGATAPAFKRIELMDGRNRCFAFRGGTVEIPWQPDCYLSLIPMSEICDGVTLTGVKYPLDNARLERGSSLSVSNEFAAPGSEAAAGSETAPRSETAPPARHEGATLTVASGSLLVVISSRVF